MALAQCTVSGVIQLPDTTVPIYGAKLVFVLSNVEEETEIIAPIRVEATVNTTTGAFSVDLWPNALGTTESAYYVTLERFGATAARPVAPISLGTIYVPDSASAAFSSLIQTPPFTPPTASIVAIATAAQSAAAASASAASGSATSSAASAVASLAAKTAAEVAQAAIESSEGFISILYESWTELLAVSGAGDGQRASVGDVDSGTHSAASGTGYDGSTVNNAGEYRWDAAWARWVRVGANALRTGALDLLGFPLSEAGASSSQAFNLASGNGYERFGVAPDGVVTFAGSQHLITTEWTQYVTQDGYGLFGVDGTGLIYGVLGPQRLAFGGYGTPTSGFPGGVITDYTEAGSYFQYNWNGFRVLGYKTGDIWAPHIVDTPIIEVMEADGQSWQTISDYTSAETLFEDTTGDTKAALENWNSPFVVYLRRASAAASGATPYLKATVSQSITVGNFYPIDASVGYSIGMMAAACREVQQRRLGLPVNTTAIIQSGWPGQSAEKFLAEGTSYTYGATTVDAALVSTESEYLWARNIVTREDVSNFLAEKYQNRPLKYRHLTWIQGPGNNAGEYTAFLTEYRSQQDALSLPTINTKRHMFGDQGGSHANLTLLWVGAQEQLEFYQTNTSGFDWLVGPRYPHKLRDYIHHSSLGALEYAERTALAQAYVEYYGEWEPLWITGVSVSGAVLTVTTNSPRQTTGPLFPDTTSISSATNGGWSLWDVTGNDAIAISSVVYEDDYVTITAAETLEGFGQVEVGYAARGVDQGTPTVASPGHMACWGNVKKMGVVNTAISPTATIDQWLCAYRKIHTL